MTIIIRQYDRNHISFFCPIANFTFANIQLINITIHFYNPFILAINELEIVVRSTIEIELNGIRMAAITGDNVPCTAYDNPITL